VAEVSHDLLCTNAILQFSLWKWDKLREIWSRVTDFGQKFESGYNHITTQKCQFPVFTCATARWCCKTWSFFLLSLQAGNYSISPGHLQCKQEFVCCNVCLEIARSSDGAKSSPHSRSDGNNKRQGSSRYYSVVRVDTSVLCRFKSPVGCCW